MARLLWLAEVLRDAGLTVHEEPGWQDRGREKYGPIRGITCHATAGSRTSSDRGEIRTILTGSETAPPPVAQLYLGRNGEWTVIASGLCNHNKVGWAGPNRGLGNRSLLGIEAANNNGRKGEPFEHWPEEQYRSYVRGVAAVARKLDLPVDRIAGHKEHQPSKGKPLGEDSTKTDPTFSMRDFRADVAALLRGEEDDMANVRQIDWEALIWRVEGLVSGREKVAGGPTKGTAIRPTVRFDALEQKVAAMGAAVAAVAPAVASKLKAEFDQIDRDHRKVLDAIDDIDDAVVDALNDEDDSPRRIAERLRAALGDRASAVGAILAED